MTSREYERSVPGELWDISSRYQLLAGSKLNFCPEVMSHQSSNGWNLWADSVELCVPHTSLQGGCIKAHGSIFPRRGQCRKTI